MDDASLETAEQSAVRAVSQLANFGANIKTWQKGQSGNPKGRPPSLERQLKRVLRGKNDLECAKVMLSIALDRDHPLCMTALKTILDRVDGPLEKLVNHKLSIPSVTFEVHLAPPGQRSLPALPVAHQDVSSTPLPAPSTELPST